MPTNRTHGGRSSVNVDVHANPNRAADVETARPGTHGRTGLDPGFSPDNLPPRAGTSRATDVDAILPPAMIVVHDAPVEIRMPAPQQSIDSYITNGRAIRSHVNDEGFRVINGRPYAALSGEGMVLVGVDPDTGLYRARLPSELRPSGPVLLRDTDSGLWYARKVVEPTTRAQVKKYLPQATDEDADAFITRFDDKDVADVELKQIQLGLPQLDYTHISITPHQHLSDVSSIDSMFAAWRTLSQFYQWHSQPDQRVYNNGRLVGFKLDINLAQWPVDRLLTLKFKSVVSLTLKGYAPLNPEVFVAQFPNIESLTVTSQLITRRTSAFPMYEHVYSRFDMGSRFVEQLATLPRLRELNLQDCGLQDDFSLRGMTGLQVLRLGNVHAARLGIYPDDMRARLSLEHQSVVWLTDPDISGMTELRVLDLTGAGLHRTPIGLDAANGPSRLEVLRLGNNALSVGPSLKAMTALQELDLSNARLDRFPEGITNEIPGKVLNLANNRIASIPESIELRAGFNLSGNPITDPASFRRLIHARVWTGTDIWLGAESTDHSVDLWLRNLPSNVSAKEVTTRRELWDGLGVADNDILVGMRKLTSTPEFRVEYPLLQGRVWRFLSQYGKADSHGRSLLRAIVNDEPSPGKMLDRLEALIQGQDLGQQNQPLHHLPKRPRLD